ncbi:hypothetical protein [Burkholderia sp. Ax-1719]|uniref:hypothetical protein n=1 Tax=Burkholderia sp. Ax-1719 TaxID=2608334 RepID=UPI0019633019|nr:hypothetical protein [Burkholderia sp. Ax-1719]
MMRQELRRKCDSRAARSGQPSRLVSHTWHLPSLDDSRATRHGLQKISVAPANNSIAGALRRQTRAAES